MLYPASYCVFIVKLYFGLGLVIKNEVKSLINDYLSKHGNLMLSFISIFHSEFENLRIWEVRQKPSISVEIQKEYIKRIITNMFQGIIWYYLCLDFSSFNYILYRESYCSLLLMPKALNLLLTQFLKGIISEFNLVQGDQNDLKEGLKSSAYGICIFW